MGSPKHANLPTSPPMLHFISLLQRVPFPIQTSPAIQFQSGWKGPWGNGCHCPNFLSIHLLLCSDEIMRNGFREHKWMKGEMTIVQRFEILTNIKYLMQCQSGTNFFVIVTVLNTNTYIHMNKNIWTTIKLSCKHSRWVLIQFILQGMDMFPSQKSALNLKKNKIKK